MTLHGVLALVITSDTPTIVSLRAHQLIVLRINPLAIMMDITVHTIVIVLILVATLMINMIAGNAISSPQGPELPC